jgi:hypothetical protein
MLGQWNMPLSVVVNIAKAGTTPGLTAAALRGAIALLTSYAEALERS